MKEDVDCVIVFTEMSIFLNKLEPIPFLFPANKSASICFSFSRNEGSRFLPFGIGTFLSKRQL